jgi:hypothetical protein
MRASSRRCYRDGANESATGDIVLATALRLKVFKLFV